jgi:hypothetical protein
MIGAAYCANLLFSEMGLFTNIISDTYNNSINLDSLLHYHRWDHVRNRWAVVEQLPLHPMVGGSSLFALFSVYLSACQSVNQVLLFVYLSLSICLSVCEPACLSICLFLCLSVCLSSCQSFFLSSCRCVYLSVCLSVSVCLSLYLSVCLFIWLSVCRSVCVPIYLFVWLSACLPACLFICLHLCL